MIPTMLGEDGKVGTDEQERAEVMIQQYQRKEVEVEQALSAVRGDYLEASRRMTKGKMGKFGWR